MGNDAGPGFETLCMHHGENREAHFGAAAPPIYQNSTFTYPDCEQFIARSEDRSERFDYTRVSNPTTAILEAKLAALERGKAARAFGSGMAAISAAILSCVRSGDHIVTIETVYGPTRTFLSEYLPRFGIETTCVRGTRVEDFAAAIRPTTRLVYVESPSSLLFDLQDLSAVAAMCKSRGAVSICDNSNATPYFQNPLAMGIDMVVHTATKYIGGHSDLVAGFAVGSRERIATLARQEGELLGGVCDPFASWLMLRGLRTLAVRLDRHSQSASRIAQWLASNPRIDRVFYPGLSSHPQADLVRRQMRGNSGMLSFRLRDASRERTFAVVDALKYFCIAVSWGGYESLAIPLEVPDFERGGKMWIIRLSVGLETVDDLVADLDRAMA